MCHLISEGIGNKYNNTVFGIVDVFREEIFLLYKTGFSVCIGKFIVPVDGNLVQVFIGINVFNQFSELLKRSGIFHTVKIEIKVPVSAVKFIGGFGVILN